ncbi:g10267 [Coccomyxa viridis]|uniref:G10267 protein n=1 Tax=Coccomyxa viridis TaxID=1274662 RepID=A0ABP1G7L3_9CHLO
MSNNDIEGDPLEFLRVSEAYWQAMKSAPAKRGPAVIRVRHRRLQHAFDCDVAVCGGTLGLLLALALQLRGNKVCIVEKRRVEGRNQEWNVSRHELQVLTELGLVTEQELQDSIASEFNPVHIGFHSKRQGPDIVAEDVLNLGVSPRRLLSHMRARFVDNGGVIHEGASFHSAEVYPEGVVIKVSNGTEEPITAGDANRPLAARDASGHSASSSSSSSDAHRNGNGSSMAAQQEQDTRQGSGAEASFSGRPDQLTCRLIIDCMGHWSPIVRQMRGSTKPDGMCLVVGSCASGFAPEHNRTADFMRTVTDAEDDLQLFWQAFPAEGGAARTTYMFSYADCAKQRPSLQGLLDRYFELLPRYQSCSLTDLKIKRVLFGGFPCYSSSPLQPQFDRIIQVGDASASQSPLSFGGFGSMLRHLQRLTDGLDQALKQDRLSRNALKLLQPYQPSLAAAWLFQRSMALKPGQLQEPRGRRGQVSGFLPPSHINTLLAANFRVMKMLGDWVMRPFLQDTIQFWPLSAAMTATLFVAPLTIMRVLVQVGPLVVLTWFRHYVMLGIYSFLHFVSRPLHRRLRSYRAQRWFDAWRCGSGADYSC